MSKKYDLKYKSSFQDIEFQSTDIGIDVRSKYEVTLYPKSVKTINTDLQLAIPEGFWIKIDGRSGLASKHGIFPIAGDVDEDYTGEVKVILANLGDEKYVIQKGEKIAQLIICKNYNSEFEIKEVKNEKEWEKIELKKLENRGNKGLGSTGKF